MSSTDPNGKANGDAVQQPEGSLNEDSSPSDPLAETIDSNVNEDSVPGSDPKPTKEETVSQYGRYRVLQRHGEGGFGTVYVGHDDTLDRRVAIKVPHGRRSASEIEDFLNEARRLARLQHAGIVAVYDADQQDGVCFIVTELIEGVSLYDQIKEQAPTWQQSLALVAQVADSLAHAHAESMIHRDIKPCNIMIRKDGRPVLLDFGLAMTDIEATGPDGNVAGTPAYMSPEQARGEAIELMVARIFIALASFCISCWRDVVHSVPRMSRNSCGRLLKTNHSRFDN